MEELKSIFNGTTIKVYLLNIMSYFSEYANLHDILADIMILVTIVYTIVKICLSIKNQNKRGKE